MNETAFHPSDIRGHYPEEVNEEIFEKVGRVCAGIFDKGVVLIAYDGRHSSLSLAKAIEKGLSEGNKNPKKKLDIQMVGPASSSMFYFLANHLKTAGVMITASHNSKEDNGAIFLKDGKLIGGKDLLEMIHKEQIKK